MDTVVLAPAGYLLDPDIGSDYERPWRLAEGLAKRGLRVVIVARHVKRLGDLGRNVHLACPPGHLPASPTGKIVDRVLLYLHARRIAYEEVRLGRTLVVHHLGPCGVQSPSLIGRLPVPFVYGPMPGTAPGNTSDDEWLSWLLSSDATMAQAALSKFVAGGAGLVARRQWQRTIQRADAVTVEAKANVPAGCVNAVVIPPGIDVAQFRPSREGRPTSGRVIAVGRLLKRKGYDVLVRAMEHVIRRHSGAHLMLLGSGPEEHRLRLLATQLGIGASVTFLGVLDRSEVPKLLRSAEVFCHPAIWDNVPFAQLEAMACGVPTLVSSAGGLPDTLGDAGLRNLSTRLRHSPREITESSSPPRPAD